MTHSSEDLLAFEVKCYDFLIQLGYQLVQDVKPTRPKYVSNIFVLTLFSGRWGDPPAPQLFDVERNQIVRSHIEALYYYVVNYLEEKQALVEISPYKDFLLSATWADATLSKKNDWIFTDPEWCRDTEFLNIMEKTSEWGMSQKKIPSQKELIEYIRAEKIKSGTDRRL